VSQAITHEDQAAEQSAHEQPAHEQTAAERADSGRADRTDGEAPVERARRIDSVDVARGVALLGILLLNVVGFGLPHWAYDDPTVAGGASGANLWVWFVNYVLFEGKMRAIFSMLFGAGVVLITAREERAGRGAAADIYYRRIMWLLAFGLVDAYFLLWPGDILFPYAVAGFLLYPLRRVAPKKLIVLGLVCLAVVPAKMIFVRREVAHMRAEATAAERAAAGGATLTTEQQGAQRAWQKRLGEMKPKPEQVEEEIKTMRSGYPTIFVHSSKLVSMLESSVLYSWWIWDMLGMMLVGMALVKLGVFSAARSSRTYWLMALAGYGLGLPLGVYVGLDRIARGFDIDSSLAASYTYDLRRLLVVVGHVGLVMLVCKSGAIPWLTRRLAAVGQMALTNYVTHTVVCTLFFYGYGLGYYGRLQRYQLYYLVGAIWLFQLAACVLWLRRFQFGPLEWAWRSLTYWRRQPMRLRPAAAGGVPTTGDARAPAPGLIAGESVPASVPNVAPAAPAALAATDAAGLLVDTTTTPAPSIALEAEAPGVAPAET
jgi:uncharacterized protein